MRISLMAHLYQNEVRTEVFEAGPESTHCHKHLRRTHLRLNLCRLAYHMRLNIQQKSSAHPLRLRIRTISHLGVRTMKALLIACAGFFGAALVAAPAQAQFHHYSPGGHSYYSGAHANHSRHHDDLEHRGYHRDLDHREAHRYPMTHRQHGRLHDHLDHQAYHDHLEHRSAHRSGAYFPGYYRPGYGGHPYYRPRGTTFFYGRPGFSIRIGR